MSLNCVIKPEIQKNRLNQNTNLIRAIISILTGCKFFTLYLKNGKISLKIIKYLKTSFYEYHLIKYNILLSLEKL